MRIVKILLLFVFIPVMAYGQEQIIKWDNDSIPILNEELRRLNTQKDSYKVKVNISDTAEYLDSKVKDSIEVDANDMHLVGDSASPGAGMFYGTNSLNVKGWYNQTNASALFTRGTTIVDITSAFDISLGKVFFNVTLTEVSMICRGGTNVTGMVHICDNNATSCIPVNSTDWTAENGTEMKITTFENRTINATGRLLWNTTTVNGNPPNFEVTVFGINKKL